MVLYSVVCVVVVVVVCVCVWFVMSRWCCVCVELPRTLPATIVSLPYSLNFSSPPLSLSHCNTVSKGGKSLVTLE